VKNRPLNFLILAVFVLTPFNIERNVFGAWVTVTDVIVAACVAVWALHLLKDQASLKNLSAPLLPVLIGFIATFLLSFIHALNPLMAVKDLIKYLVMFAFFYLLVNSIDEWTLRKLVLIIIGTATALGIYLLHDYFTGFLDPLHRTWDRKFISNVHLSVVGTFLDASIPISFYLLFSRKNLCQKLLAAASILVQISALYISFSRACWLAMIIVLLAMLFYKFRSRGIIYFGLILIASFTLLTLIFPNLDVQKRFFSIGDRQDVSIVSRKEHLSAALAMIKKEPLIGVGLGNFKLAAKTYYNLELTGHAHNEFLHFAAEAGILSMLFFAGLIIKYYFDAWKIIKSLSMEDRFRGPLIYGLFAFSGIFIACFVGDPFLRGTKEYFILFMSLPYAVMKLKGISA
jgi:O-antigen ligase